MKFYHLKTFYQTFLHSQRNLWIKSLRSTGIEYYSTRIIRGNKNILPDLDL